MTQHTPKKNVKKDPQQQPPQCGCAISTRVLPRCDDNPTPCKACRGRSVPPRCAAQCVHTINILHNVPPCTVHIDTLTGTITLAMRQCEDKDGSMWDQRRTKMKRRAYPHNPDKPRESDLQPTSNYPASCTPHADQSATQHKHTTVLRENSTQHNLNLAS
jgi:hypothetical protein